VSGRGVVAIGGSAGGLEALRDLVGRLPADLPAAVLVALHVPAGPRSRLPEILSRSGPLPASPARDGEPVEPGRIYVAPPDRHLLVADSRIQLGSGPREHGFRPAVDPLFRSVARAYGTAAAGVVLSGILDDGTAGLAAIKRHGGVAVVQDPAEARYDGMPASAIDHVAVDHVGSVAEIAGLLAELTRPSEEVSVMSSEESDQVGWEVGISLRADGAPLSARPGPGWEPSPFSCPDCNGVLWERREGDLERYRCRIGHGWSPQTVAHQQAERVDSRLWTVLKDVEEQAEFADHLSQAARDHDQQKDAAYWAKQANRAERTAAGIRELLADRGGGDPLRRS